MFKVGNSVLMSSHKAVPSEIRGKICIVVSVNDETIIVRHGVKAPYTILPKYIEHLVPNVGDTIVAFNRDGIWRVDGINSNSVTCTQDEEKIMIPHNEIEEIIEMSSAINILPGDIVMPIDGSGYSIKPRKVQFSDVTGSTKLQGFPGTHKASDFAVCSDVHIPDTARAYRDKGQYYLLKGIVPYTDVLKNDYLITFPLLHTALNATEPFSLKVETRGSVKEVSMIPGDKFNTPEDVIDWLNNIITR